MLGICWHTRREQAVQVLLLRQQVRILQRQVHQQKRLSRSEKLTLAVLAAKLKQWNRQPTVWLEQYVLLFKRATVLKWHRELVKRKWTFAVHSKPVGRPRTAADLDALVVRLAQENLGMGYGKIAGELLKLGYNIGETTIRDILARHGIAPAPLRNRCGSNWHMFLAHYKQQILACDFFTIETIFLKTIYVLFFIDLGTRRVYVAGCTGHPDSAWVTQQARQLTWQLQEQDSHMRFLIHDRDTKFTSSFEAVFATEGIETVLTPFRAPKANAFAERWVRSIRQECLDQLLIVNQRHLKQVLHEYSTYYNMRRPHQGLLQQSPLPYPILPTNECGVIGRRDILGGIIHDYFRQAA
jgi:putative transposase